MNQRPDAARREELRPEPKALIDALRSDESGSMDAVEVGRQIRDAVMAGQFWVFPNGASHVSAVHRETSELSRMLVKDGDRLEGVLDGGPGQGRNGEGIG